MQHQPAYQKILDETVAFVKTTLAHAEGGHDWWHTCRVWQNAKHIAKESGMDMQVVELAALLHDIADAKFYEGDESVGSGRARDFLNSQGVEASTIDHVVNIIRHMSFKNSFEENSWTSPEMQILQDADRLDAMGAIGIARAFSYGGFKGRAFYDPAIPPDLNMDKETYKKSTAPTINHFYEKLLLLKEGMNTETGKAMAEDRHKFMEIYLEQFYKEWEGVS
jgi:uncharacterized protein